MEMRRDFIEFFGYEIPVPQGYHSFQSKTFAGMTGTTG
jgi:hypothetical protein